MGHWSQNACLGPVNEHGTLPPCQLPASASLTPLQAEAGIPGVGVGGGEAALGGRLHCAPTAPLHDQQVLQ